MIIFDPEETRVNVAVELIHSHIHHALSLGLPEFKPEDLKKSRLVVCAGGPSLKSNLKRVRREKKRGATIFCVNGALGYLVDNGIIPDACVLCDANEILLTQVSVVPGVRYYLASCCAPVVFKKLEGQDIVLWHSFNNVGEEKLITGDRWIIHGGNTAALRCLNVGHMLGYRDFVYYGLDSSFEDKQHAYGGAIENTTILEVDAEGRKFKTSYQLAVQARDFNNMFQLLWDSRIRAVGDGLIPHMSSILNRRKYGHSTESVRRLPEVLPQADSRPEAV